MLVIREKNYSLSSLSVSLSNGRSAFTIELEELSVDVKYVACFAHTRNCRKYIYHENRVSANIDKWRRILYHFQRNVSR